MVHTRNNMQVLLQNNLCFFPVNIHYRHVVACVRGGAKHLYVPYRLFQKLPVPGPDFGKPARKTSTPFPGSSVTVCSLTRWLRFRFTPQLITNSKRAPTYPCFAYPRHPQTLKWKEFLHKQMVEGLGYVPGVCWIFFWLKDSTVPNLEARFRDFSRWQVM